jgi:hypothetical protein
MGRVALPRHLDGLRQFLPQAVEVPPALSGITAARPCEKNRPRMTARLPPALQAMFG